MRAFEQNIHSAPGSDEPPYMTENEYLIVDASDDIDEEPTLTQLGLSQARAPYP